MGSEGVVESVDPFGVDGDGGADGGGSGGSEVTGLPADVLEVWGGSAAGRELAAVCVADWGLDAFRSSVVHQMAVAERGRVPKAGMLARRVLADPKKKP